MPQHDVYFRPVVNGIYGNAMLVNWGYELVDEGEASIFENPEYQGMGPAYTRNLQWVRLPVNDKDYTIVNIHGLWNGKGKTDSPERLAQSQKIKQFVDSLSTSKIVCGDFNLRPGTDSIRLLEQGYRNLIKDYNVTSTRTSYYPKEEQYANYIFTCPQVEVNHFAVLPDEVSDHAPLVIKRI